jgi:hypothetical protein
MRQILSHHSSAAMVIAVVALFLALNAVGSANVSPHPAPAAKGVPPGAVMFFARRGCPTGWKLFTEARGRYIVGLPRGGTLLGQDGSALSNLEDRPTGQHTHTINDPGHSHNLIQDLQPLIINNPDPNHPFAGSVGFAQSAFTNGTGLQRAWIPDVIVSRIPAITDVQKTGITINPAGDVAGTNAPYVQLLVCKKT